MPFYVADVAGIDVRFFKSPQSILSPPWAAYIDMHRATKQPTADFQRCVEWFDVMPERQRDTCAKVVPAFPEPVMIVTLEFALGFLGAVGSDGRSAVTLVNRCIDAIAEATKRWIAGASADLAEWERRFAS